MFLLRWCRQDLIVPRRYIVRASLRNFFAAEFAKRKTPATFASPIARRAAGMQEAKAEKSKRHLTYCGDSGWIWRIISLPGEIKKEEKKVSQNVAKREKLLTFALPKRKRASKIRRIDGEKLKGLKTVKGLRPRLVEVGMDKWFEILVEAKTFFE